MNNNMNNVEEKINTETLGARLRNLLTPYKSLLTLVKDVTEGKMDIEVLKKYKFDNLDEIIKFSNSEKMENNFCE